MDYGVFTSRHLEIAQTRFGVLCLYCSDDKSIIRAKLYNGTDGGKTLAAVCERNNSKNKTVYAYEVPDGQNFTNDTDGVCKLIGSAYAYKTADLKKIDDIIITQPYDMPKASESDIGNCLKQWRMGTFYRLIHNGMQFQMVTNKIEYIFMIQNNDCNIYCGASINIPYNGGLFGGGQYFRVRNYADNSQGFCGFYCNIGNSVETPVFDKIICESGKCTSTAQGLYWPLKRFTEDEIVLDGCGGDEYIYNRNSDKSEYFRINY